MNFWNPTLQSGDCSESSYSASTSDRMKGFMFLPPAEPCAMGDSQGAAENSAGSVKELSFAPAPEFYCGQESPSFNESCSWSRQGLQWESCRRAHQQREWRAPTVFVCFHISNMSNIYLLRSFKNPFLCFYPLYLLSCFVSERAKGTDFQAMRAWCNLQVQCTARNM